MNKQFTQTNKFSIAIAVITFVLTVGLILSFRFIPEVTHFLERFLFFSKNDFQIAAVIITVVIFMVTLVFSTLSIMVNSQTIRWNFGLGFWKKSIPLKDIIRFKIVKNKWWYGWGIRQYPGGWLYNVSGFEALELHLKNGKNIRLGSNDPKRLKHAIEQAINKLNLNPEKPHHG